ncbi:MAG: hypothetical protein V2J42_05795 [Wenzhouxiangella sp.]|nr:hypothetical protein [Wenzhouxiangella sp.]
MNTFIKSTVVTTLGLAALLATDYASAQPEPESLDQEQCPPQCGVRIDVPRMGRQAPSSVPETLEVEIGQSVSFSTNVLSRVIFTGETPFVDERGNPVFQFLVDDSVETRLKVTEDGKCSVEPGCKYIIIDATNPGRPARDPYIIIRRR